MGNDFFLSFKYYLERESKVIGLKSSECVYAPYPRFLHALGVSRRFVQAEKLPHGRGGPHGVILQDGVDERLQALYPVVDEPAAEVVAEPLFARQHQLTVRELDPEAVLQPDKVGVAAEHQPAGVRDGVFDA